MHFRQFSLLLVLPVLLAGPDAVGRGRAQTPVLTGIQNNKAARHDRSQALTPATVDTAGAARGSAAVEQTRNGARPAPVLLASFDGLGEGFSGPQGTAFYRNPSDNALAVGPDHIFQIVNTRMAIYTKKGKKYDTTGRILYGPGETRSIFKGFGGPCERFNNGDAMMSTSCLTRT